MKSLILFADKDRSLRRRHPWVFSGAIAREPAGLGCGETVDLRDADGVFLARGAYSGASQIRVRVWTFDEHEAVDADFFAARIERALAARRALVASGETNACRLINAESDGLPGLVVDRYGEVVVCQFLAAGPERWRDVIVEALARMSGAGTIYERSDVEVRVKEGLPSRVGVLAGAEPPELVEIVEHGLRYAVDVRAGHKTGFYLDQRASRRAAARYGEGREVLNAFSYTGAFAVAALAAGAVKVTNVDSSSSALALGVRNLALNGLPADRVENVEADVFTLLRRFRDSRRAFDMIVLDPPKFAASRVQMDKAARGYKDINLLAFKLLRAGGVLLTFSCSGLMTPELFQKIVADAALDAGRDAQIVDKLGQPPDHPIALPFPEGAYLKGLVCRVS